MMKVTVTKPKRCPACGELVELGTTGIVVHYTPPALPNRPRRPRTSLYHPDCFSAAHAPKAVG